MTVHFPYRTTDPDEARKALDSHLPPMWTEPVDATAAPEFAFDIVQQGPIVLAELACDVDLRTGLGDLDAYLVHAPLSGHLDGYHGRAGLVATPRRAAVYAPGEVPLRTCTEPQSSVPAGHAAGPLTDTPGGAP